MKALFYALTAEVGFAARRGMEMPGRTVEMPGKTVAQVMESMGSLLQQRGDSHLDSIARFAETPGANDALIDALNDVIQQLELDVETKIKAGHLDTQNAIDSSIDQVKAATDRAVEFKSNADVEDTAWFNCVESEKTKRIAIEDANTALQAAIIEESEACQAQQDARQFNWQSPGLEFVCDIQEHGNCNQQMTNYLTQIEDMNSGLQSDVTSAEGVFTQAKNRCDVAKVDLAEKQSAHSDALEAWSAQRALCLQKHEARQVSLCLFGAELQLKCSAAGAHTDLMAKVNGAGSEYSEADRHEEWDTVSVTKCMLHVVIAGGDLDSSLSTCEAEVNYERDVSALDQRESEFDDLMTPEKFTCSESTITFGGQTWVITNGGEASSDYNVEDYHPAVNVEEGSVAFDFCEVAGPGK